MVYCGKPSKSCRECRKRDIKCDKLVGSCGQCKRAQLVCPGYPDSQSLVFRDETKRVIEKKGKASVLAATKRPVSGHGSRQGLSNLARIPPEKSNDLIDEVSPVSNVLFLPHCFPPTTMPPSYSLEELAKTFFIQTQLLDFKPHLPTYAVLHSIGATNPIHFHLVFAARAVSLMYFSKYHYSTTAMQTAQRNYAAALYQIQAQILDTEGSRHDSTLMAVLFLGIFEKLASDVKIGWEERGGKGEDKRSVSKQLMHLDGALQLVKVRGHKQYQGWTGISLFRQLSSAILTNCLEKETEIPVQFVTARISAGRYRNTLGPPWRLEDVVMRLIALKVGLKVKMFWDNEIDAMSRDLNDKCLELYHFLLNEVVLSIPNGGSNHVPRRLKAMTALQQLLNYLSIIRLVLIEITPTTLLFTKAKADVVALCNTIYESAIEGASSNILHIFSFSLYVAARSSFCPPDLKGQIKDLLKMEESHDCLQILRLIENKENNLEGEEEQRVRNPWKEFADQGLGELIIFGCFE